jgi:glycerol-3-phosphate dehydrogenase
MWQSTSRERAWEELKRPFDLVVIGGGITGAGVALEASRAGLKTCLLEQRDYAWGTSSWSSKMVHGGLRYLKQGDIRLTLDSVRERKRLLQELPGLVAPLEFILPVQAGRWSEKLLLKSGLWAYDLLAFEHRHCSLTASALVQRVPFLRDQGLSGGLSFQDALTDDSRLVMAVLQESLFHGTVLLNQCPVLDIMSTRGRVCGVVVRDRLSGQTRQVRSRAVVNATGAWADKICSLCSRSIDLRPLRGSHLVLRRRDLPVPCSVIVPHPDDRRPIFAFPWENATVIGTTDLDHDQPMEHPARMERAELDYLLSGARAWFPDLGLDSSLVLSSFSGVRPVLAHKCREPSREPRRHVVLDHQGLITVTGGKLTTFRLIARDALRAVRDHIGSFHPASSRSRLFSSLPEAQICPSVLAPDQIYRLQARFRHDVPGLLGSVRSAERVPGTATLLDEVRWSIRHEQVVHLEDLMLRRTRLGLLLENGGQDHLEGIAGICARELGWSQARRQREIQAYLQLWNSFYAPCPQGPESEQPTLEQNP